MNTNTQEQAQQFFNKTKKNPAETLFSAVESILKNQTKDVYSKSRDILLLNIGAAQAALWALAQSLKITTSQSGSAYLENPILDTQEDDEPTKPETPPHVPKATKRGFKPLEAIKPKAGIVVTATKQATESPIAYAQRLRLNRKGQAYIATALEKRFGKKIAKETISSLAHLNPPKKWKNHQNHQKRNALHQRTSSQLSSTKPSTKLRFRNTAPTQSSPQKLFPDHEAPPQNTSRNRFLDSQIK